MAVWEAPDLIPGLKPFMRDFARTWQGADKVVYSGSLKTVATTKTRLERDFDARAVRNLKALSRRDLSVVVRRSPHTRFGPTSSTSITCSSGLLYVATACESCLVKHQCIWIFCRSAGS
jgi:hypothetical protein